MKLYTIFGIVILLMIVSCRAKINSVNSGYSEIAIIANASEHEYLLQSLIGFAKASNMAKDYLKELSELGTKAKELKVLLEKEQVSSIDSQKRAFINSFHKSLKYVTSTDSINLELLRKAPVRSSEDIDMLLLFAKRTYVNQLSNDRYLFDYISTTAVAENLNVKKGENVSITMSITAANTKRPAQWFILKDSGEPLTKENISDTLHSDEFGNAIFKQRADIIGDNKVLYATKIPSTNGEVILYNSVNFRVR